MKNFDPNRDFESVSEAVKYCEKQTNPVLALKMVACANIDQGEYGFASELIAEFPDKI